MKKRNLIISVSLILLSIIYTFLVKNVDVQSIGVNGTNIGFATINKFVFENVGVHMMCYRITEWLGVIPILSVFVYAVLGMVQLIKRKSLFKVDKEIIILGIFYVLVAGVYVFFEKVVINYRPVLLDGILEASYPSSHTLISTCFCISAILINKRLFSGKYTKYINAFLAIVCVLIVVGRLVSGVHWFSDIVGGLIISSTLLVSFYSVLNLINKKN